MRSRVDAVLFDFSGTVMHVEDVASWLAAALAAIGADGAHADALVPEFRAAGLPWAPTTVPASLAAVFAARDRTAADHRAAYTGVWAPLAGRTPGLVDALYERARTAEAWVPYADAAPVLSELRSRGVRTALVSNIGFDARPVLAGHGLDGLFDAVVLSYEVGAVKPEPGIFRAALDAVGMPAERTLMVGDSVVDGGAVALGIRSLLLPASPPGAVHGLDAVLTLLGR